MKCKAGKAYKKRLSAMGDRSSNSQQWDMVYYKLSSTLFHIAVNEYLAICRVSIQFLGLYKTYFVIENFFFGI